MSLFIETAFGQSGKRAPVWIMRQAGRYLPEYRALKEKYSFWELCRTPELACEVTLQPLKRFALDAAILFQDIMTPLPPMGVKIDFKPGPVFEAPIRTEAAVDALDIPDKEEIAPYVSEAIKLIRQESLVPLIGFGGAPLTLATYMIQGSGSKDYETLRQFLRCQPEASHKLLNKLTEVSIRYLQMQIEAGAQAIQLFDSWAGLHDTRIYQEFALPYNQKIFNALAPYKIPRLYIAVNAFHLYQKIRQLPCEVISVDWRVPLHDIRPQLKNKTLQGNLDPATLLAPKEVLQEEALRVLQSGLGGAHIFNLGHGIMKETDPNKLAFLVDTVHSFDREVTMAN